MAVIVTDKAESVTKEEIYGHLDGKVARFKYPQHIEGVDELPLTATMKGKKSMDIPEGRSRIPVRDVVDRLDLREVMR